MSTECPICACPPTDFKRFYQGYSGNYYDCPNCGSYFSTDRALRMLEHKPQELKARLSHAVWSGQDPNAPFDLSSTHIQNMEDLQLPGPTEQLDNLIAYWGRNQSGRLSHRINKAWNELPAKLGAVTSSDVDYVAQEAIRRGLIDGKSAHQHLAGTLTFKGWDEYRRIERGQFASRHAFMAMPFNNAPITKIVDEVFRPAVKETGFTLKRLDDKPEAGVIDNRMRVEIRHAKFLIADLTDENRGAYWEAGYAEGLGKPVIYTCERSYFESNSTHFDTNHCTTIVWDDADRVKAAEDLKATIRNTFPFEAIMPKEDDQ